MSERLFFALWPGGAQRRALTRVQRELTPHRGPHRGRETHALDIHLTLIFLGRISPQQRTCAEQVAERVRGHPFEVTLERIGYFPRSRVCWCGTDVCPQPLERLVGALNGALEACGFVPERRPYRPHVTLMRKAAPFESRALACPIRWPVVDFVLAYGQDGPAPRYRILRRWSLLP